MQLLTGKPGHHGTDWITFSIHSSLLPSPCELCLKYPDNLHPYWPFRISCLYLDSKLKLIFHCVNHSPESCCFKSYLDRLLMERAGERHLQGPSSVQVSNKPITVLIGHILVTLFWVMNKHSLWYKKAIDWITKLFF